MQLLEDRADRGRVESAGADIVVLVAAVAGPAAGRRQGRENHRTERAAGRVAEVSSSLVGFEAWRRRVGRAVERQNRRPETGNAAAINQTSAQCDRMRRCETSGDTGVLLHKPAVVSAHANGLAPPSENAGGSTVSVTPSSDSICRIIGRNGTPGKPNSASTRNVRASAGRFRQKHFTSKTAQGRGFLVELPASCRTSKLLESRRIWPDFCSRAATNRSGRGDPTLVVP